MDVSFEFDDLVEFCVSLLDNKDKINPNNYQCLYRTIASRLYYAAFHHAKLWLEINYNFKTRELNLETGKFQNIDNLSEHIQVYKELRNVSDYQKHLKLNFRLASSKLENLFDRRVEADYEEFVIFNDNEIKGMFDDARYIIQLLPFN